MNPLTIYRLLDQLPEELYVNETDKRAWMDNPCTAVFLMASVALVYQTFTAMMEAKGMNDVCEVRGMYRALEKIHQLPDALHTVEQGGLSREDAGSILQKIEEHLNARRDH